MNISPWAKVCLFLGFLAFFTVFAGHHRQAAVIKIESMPRRAYREAYLLPQPSTLQVLSLGHTEMMADLIWVRALSYFAVHFSLDRDYRWLDRYIETVVALDPEFRVIYEWAGMATIYGGQLIDNEAVSASNRFLEMGLERYPDDWRLNFMLGCNYRYELQPTNDEERAQWRRLGAFHLARAGKSSDAPAWLTLTAGRIYERLGDRDESIALDRHTFLSAPGITSATNQADLRGRAHVPTFGYQTLRRMNASGISLRRLLDEPSWWRLLQYRRMLLLDQDTTAGFLTWERRALIFGEPDLRVGPLGRTSIDSVFYPTLDSVRGIDD